MGTDQDKTRSNHVYLLSITGSNKPKKVILSESESNARTHAVIQVAGVPDDKGNFPKPIENPYLDPDKASCLKLKENEHYKVIHSIRDDRIDIKLLDNPRTFCLTLDYPETID